MLGRAVVKVIPREPIDVPVFTEEELPEVTEQDVVDGEGGDAVEVDEDVIASNATRRKKKKAEKLLREVKYGMLVVLGVWRRWTFHRYKFQILLQLMQKL